AGVSEQPLSGGAGRGGAGGGDRARGRGPAGAAQAAAGGGERPVGVAAASAAGSGGGGAAQPGPQVLRRGAEADLQAARELGRGVRSLRLAPGRDASLAAAGI